MFTTLLHPDPSLPYVLEVDASEVAIGAVISQCQGPRDLLHPVAFFSHKLSPAKRNYDAGDRVLLTIKAALEEWRYLLEGAAYPILVYTDHRNLKHLRTAKRLKPRQACWALFFSQFVFHITCRPGLKNVKPGALSHMLDNPREPPVSHTILSEGNFLLLQTDLLSWIKQASAGAPSPPGVTLTLREGLLWNKDKAFVPENVGLTILGLCHYHPLAGHFGIHQILELLRRTFWWPDLEDMCKKVCEFLCNMHPKQEYQKPSLGSPPILRSLPGHGV